MCQSRVEKSSARKLFGNTETFRGGVRAEKTCQMCRVQERMLLCALARRLFEASDNACIQCYIYLP